MSPIKLHFAAILILCAVVGGCAGCLGLKVQDKSSAAKYRGLVGSVVTIKAEFKVYGVRMNLRAQTPDFYQMIPAKGAGVDGPEIMKWGRLPAGTHLRLVAAFEETLFGATLYEMVVLDSPERKFDGIKIRVNNAAAFGLYRGGKYPGGAPRLNGEWFSELEYTAP